jgi:hypothetical protein
MVLRHSVVLDRLMVWNAGLRAERGSAYEQERPLEAARVVLLHLLWSWIPGRRVVRKSADQSGIPPLLLQR